jgi:hypothetical protein
VTVYGIYAGWLEWQNLGDEALFEVCRRQLPRIRWSGAALEEPPVPRATLAGARKLWLRCTHQLIPGRTVGVFGGGTLLNRTPLWLEQYRALRRTSRKPVPVFSPGVADPEYWKRFDGWRDTRAEWRAELADLPEIGVRGPRSKRLLDEAGFRNVSVTGDPALALRRATAPSPPDGRRAVAINIGQSNGSMWGSEELALAAMASAAARLANAGFEVHIFPVWNQDVRACRAVARAARLPDDAVDPLILDPDAFLRYLDRFDVVIAIKLHAAVLAAAAGVPFVAVEYRPKVRDFTESVGWSRFTFRSDAVEGKDLERAARDLYGELEQFRSLLDARVGELAATFGAYAARMEEALLSP